MKLLSLGLVPSLFYMGSACAAVTIQAWEFNSAGDFEGFVDFQDRGSSSVAGGVMSGTAALTGNSDIQIRTQGGAGNPLRIGVGGTFLDIADYTELTFSITVLQTNPGAADLGVAFANKEFVGATAGNIGGLPVSPSGQGGENTVTAGANNFQTFEYNLLTILAGDTTPGESSFDDSILRSIRIDPTAGNSNGFSIQRMEISGTAIPEPSATILGGLSLLTLLRRRR